MNTVRRNAMVARRGVSIWKSPECEVSPQGMLQRRGVLRERHQRSVDPREFLEAGRVCPTDFCSRTDAQDVKQKGRYENASEPKEDAGERMFLRLAWLVVVHVLRVMRVAFLGKC
jgi:hypothetical protein